MVSDLYQLERLENMVNIHDSERIPVKSADRKAGPYPYYGASGITDYIHEFIFDGDFVLLSEDGDNLRSRNTPIAFMARGQFWVNNHAHILKGKKGNDTNFICYALQFADITSYISGSTRPKITQKDMKKIQIFSPPKPEQKAIAHVLGKIDDKIELNRKMNETLEAMAQALFKSWFVDFDPVIDNALTAGNPIPEALKVRAEARMALGDQRKPLPEDIRQQFPSRFTFSEEMGWIPDGWEVKSLDNVVELIGGGTPKTTIEEYWIGEMPWFSVVDAPNPSDVFVLDTEKHISQLGLDQSSTKLLPEGTTIISARGTVGKCAVVAQPMAMNQSCYGIRGKGKVADYYVYYTILLQVADLQNKGHGSVFNTITRDTFKTIKIPYCQAKLTLEFHNLIRPYFRKILKNSKESFSLKKLRDSLLPKLLSGELRIPDAEKLLQEAV